jgi:hypothetical protein
MAENQSNQGSNIFEPSGQQERSGGGQRGDEKNRQRQVTDQRGDTEAEFGNEDKESPGNFVYDERELKPGGTGKQGDQQQMGQDDREARKDKSRNQGGSDEMHVDERAE